MLNCLSRSYPLLNIPNKHHLEERPFQVSFDVIFHYLSLSPILQILFDSTSGELIELFRKNKLFLDGSHLLDSFIYEKNIHANRLQASETILSLTGYRLTKSNISVLDLAVAQPSLSLWDCIHLNERRRFERGVHL